MNINIDIPDWCIHIFLTGLVLTMVFVVGLQMIEEESESIPFFCKGVDGYKEITVCDYHLPFVGDVGCYETKIYCGGYFK